MNRAFFSLVLCLLTLELCADPAKDYTRNLYQRLVAVSPDERSFIFRKGLEHVQAGKFEAAARLFTDEDLFYEVLVKNFAAPYGNEREEPSQKFNDLQALFIGSIRDNLDARLLLMGNFRYEAPASQLGLPEASLADNEHFTMFEAQGYSSKDLLYKRAPQWDDIPEAAGVFTTRTWAHAHYNMGTNRQAVQYTFRQLLCSPLTKVRDFSLPDHFVRRDVFRKPAGDPHAYQNECRNCHSILDSLGGAFARLDFANGVLVHSGSDRVQDKMNINAHHYPEGYITVDDYWQNLLQSDQHEAFGWRGDTKGYGIAEFAKMIANSQQYSRCLTRKIFSAVCRKTPRRSHVERLSSVFEADGYRLRDHFARVSVDDSCVKRPLEAI